MRRKQKSRKVRRPKARLALPDLDQSKAAVIGSLRSPVRLAVARRLAYEAADAGLLSPELAASTSDIQSTDTPGESSTSFRSAPADIGRLDDVFVRNKAGAGSRIRSDRRGH
jgi:hypothetical protein